MLAARAVILGRAQNAINTAPKAGLIRANNTQACAAPADNTALGVLTFNNKAAVNNLEHLDSAILISSTVGIKDLFLGLTLSAIERASLPVRENKGRLKGKQQMQLGHT